MSKRRRAFSPSAPPTWFTSVPASSRGAVFPFRKGGDRHEAYGTQSQQWLSRQNRSGGPTENPRRFGSRKRRKATDRLVERGGRRPLDSRRGAGGHLHPRRDHSRRRRRKEVGRDRRRQRAERRLRHGWEASPALNFVGFPVGCLPLEELRPILQGGQRKVIEAGAILAEGTASKIRNPSSAWPSTERSFDDSFGA